MNVYAGDLIQHIGCTNTGACTGKLTRPNTSFGSITYTLNGARQNYDALIVAVKGRFARRAFITASYTRSRDMDDASTYPTSETNLYYGPSTYDVPNRISVGTTYQVPGLAKGKGVLGVITDGYTVSGIVALQSGQPFSVAVTTPFAATLINPVLGPVPGNLKYTSNSGDYNADGRNLDFPNVSSYAQPTDRQSYIKGIFPTCSAGNLSNCGNFSQPAFGQEGNEQVNRFRNPGFAQTDITLEKITKIREGIDFRLRVDAFNAFNRVNLGNVDGTANDTTFGQVTATSGTPRYFNLGARVNF